jgi:hypothetical protein
VYTELQSSIRRDLCQPDFNVRWISSTSAGNLFCLFSCTSTTAIHARERFQLHLTSMMICCQSRCLGDGMPSSWQRTVNYVCSVGPDDSVRHMSSNQYPVVSTNIAHCFQIICPTSCRLVENPPCNRTRHVHTSRISMVSDVSIGTANVLSLPTRTTSTSLPLDSHKFY